jgi:hypothetical protein
MDQIFFGPTSQRVRISQSGLLFLVSWGDGFLASKPPLSSPPRGTFRSVSTVPDLVLVDSRAKFN